MMISGSTMTSDLSEAAIRLYLRAISTSLIQFYLFRWSALPSFSVQFHGSAKVSQKRP